MAACCPPDAWPALKAPADYTGQGTVSALEDLSIYTVGTPGAKVRSFTLITRDVLWL